MMKKKLFGYSLCIAVLLGMSSAVNAATPIHVPVKDLGSSINSCEPTETLNRYFYLETDGIYTNPADDFHNTSTADALALTGNEGASIDIWRGKKGDEVLRNDSCKTWEQKSTIVKKDQTAVVYQNTDNCIFNIPTYTKTGNPNAIDAQIHYSLYFKLQRADGTLKLNNIPLYYTIHGENQPRCYSNNNSTSNTDNCKTNISLYDKKFDHLGECINYRVFWCGDGLINRPDGSTSYDNQPGYTYNEECDPKHPDWINGKDGQICNLATCQIQDAPACNSTYNGKKVYTANSTPYINKNTTNLCEIGSHTQFLPLEFSSTQRIKYSWQCTIGVASIPGAECTFEQYRCGDGKWSGTDTDWSKFINGQHYEVCDKTSDEWKNGKDGVICDNNCGYANAVCGQASSTTAVYNKDYPKSRLKESELCKTGKLKEGSFSGPDSNGDYTWICINGTKETNPSCGAKDLWCGDGVKNGSEQCDPEDKRDPSVKGRGTGTWVSCDASCKTGSIPRTGPVCNPSISGHTEYTTYSTNWLNENSGLCERGEVKAGSFKSEWSVGNQRKFTWKCENDDLDITCTAKQEWCGDGIKNGSEACDYKDTENKSGWGDGCNTACTGATYNDATCGTRYNGRSAYKSGNYVWLTETSKGLCPDGLRVINFSNHFPETLDGHTYTWQCENGTGINKKTSNLCRADLERCGDGVKNGDEVCDYNDTKDEKGWGNDGCSTECKAKNITHTGGCDETFYFTLRQGYDYSFGDIFHANDSDRRLYGTPVVTFVEQKDFNRGDNPVFRRANWNSEKKVSKGDSIQVVESTPKYHIYDHPDERSYDNIYIEYALKYANAKNVPEYRRLDHKECVHYEISRCGDGKIDTEWEKKGINDEVEECDPKHPDWINRTDGQTCDPVTCKPVKVANGKLIPDKKVIGSKEIKSTGDIVEWSLKVTASGGDVTNFVMEDTLPRVLGYTGSTPLHTPSGITIGTPTVSTGSSGGKIVDIVKWTVTGTLKKDDYVEIKLTSYAKVMPDKEYKNVLCVRPKDNPDKKDCDPEPIRPICNSKYNGQVVNNLTDKDDLCTVGSLTKGSFKKTNTGWEWKCSNKAGTESCFANRESSPKGEPYPQKTLIGPKEIKSTGDIVKWKLRVTASGGDISGFTMRDVLPVVLGYSGYKVTHTGGMTVSKPTTGTTKNSSGEVVETVLWKVTGSLASGNYVEIELDTYAKVMPEKEYDNVLCVRPENKENEEKCVEVPIPPVPTKGGKLEIIKTLISQNKYVTHKGQGLEWKITIRAKNGNVKLEKIRDKFPAEYLSFTGYEKLGDWKKEGITITHFEVDEQGGEARWNVTGTLQSGHKIEFKVFTIVHTMPEGTVKNVACVKPVDPGKEECGDAYTSDLRIKKSVWNKNTNEWASSTTGNSGDTITYMIEFGNYGNTGAYVSVKDFLPKDIQVTASELYVKYGDLDENDQGIYNLYQGSDNVKPYKGTRHQVQGVYINQYSGIYLKAGGNGVMIITGTALKPDDDKRNRTNFACIYDENGNKIACDDAVYNVEEEKEVQCITLQGYDNPETLGCDENPRDRPAEVVCRSSRPAKIEILCVDSINGESKVVKTDDGVTELKGSCTFTGLAHNYAKCRINSKVDNNKCVAEYNMENGGCHNRDPKCDKIEVDGNNVTCHADEDAYFKIEGCKIDKNYSYQYNDEKVPGKKFTFECDRVYSNVRCIVSATRSFDQTDNSKVCEKRGPRPEPTDDCRNNDTDPLCLFASPDCFNVNEGNVSIEKTEILPIYMNIRKQDNPDYKYKLIKNRDFKYEDFEEIEGDACNSPGTVALNSMKCTYIIRDGDNKIVFKGEDQCLSEDLQKESGLVKARIDWQNDKYTNGGVMETYYDNENNYTYSAHVTTTKPTDWRVGSEEESNLNGLKISNLGEYKFQIEKVEYYQCLKNADGDGEWSKGETNLVICQSNFVITEPYTVQKTPSGNLKASTDTLYKFKYVDGNNVIPFSNLLSAISTTTYTPNSRVSEAMDDFINKYDKLAVKVNTNENNSKFKLSDGTSIRKVPGKDIYFVDGNITIKGGSTINKPFTLVQKNGSTTINGNVDYNMMLLTRKNIIFSGTCTSNQTVKGIYYAEGSLIRTGVLHNDSLNNEVWCDKGGLNIKGVLIGNGFNDLMKNSRSHLDNWYSSKTAKTIMNGASVLIEYSPSIFTKSTMPPGAEDFTTALSIYRQ